MTRLAFSLAVLLVAGCTAAQVPKGGGYLDSRTNMETGTVIAQPAVASAASESSAASSADLASTPAPLPQPAAAPAAVSYSGRASWYAANGDVASVPWWKAGQDPVWAVVSRFADGRTYNVTVLILGFCQCYVGTDRERVIDLSDNAFRQLAPLSVGLIRVTVELTDSGPGLPATDSLEGP